MPLSLHAVDYLDCGLGLVSGGFADGAAPRLAAGCVLRFGLESLFDPGSFLFEFEVSDTEFVSEFVSELLPFTSRAVSAFLRFVFELALGFFGLSEIISSILSVSSSSLMFLRVLG